ncbi:MAG: hypothetical protein HOP20_10730 [Sulfuriferula sp.]|nr:hypothetical protein [Sulfuriferula sp.]
MKRALIIATLILTNTSAQAVLPGGCYPKKLPNIASPLTIAVPMKAGAWKITALDDPHSTAEEVCVKETEWQAFMHERATSGEEGCEPVKFTQTLLKATSKLRYLRVGYTEICHQGSKTVTHTSTIDSAIAAPQPSALTQYQLTVITSIAGRKQTEVQRYRYERIGNCVGQRGEIIGE